MANRHSHKKLRAEVRARMERTGESYQQALQRLTGEDGAERRPHPDRRSSSARLPSSRSEPSVTALDFTEFHYFGKPALIASWRMHGVPVAVLLSEVAGGLLLGKPFTRIHARGWR